MRAPTGAAGAALLLLAGLAGTASSQVSGTLDMGAGTYRPDRAIPGGLASLAPSIRFDAGAFQFGGTGIYSDAPGGRWNFQGTGRATVRSPRLAIFQVEAAGEVDWTRHHRVAGATSLAGELRAYASPARNSTVWFGRTMGTAWSLGRRRPLQRSQIGTSARLGPLDLALSLASTSFDLMVGPASPTDPTSQRDDSTTIAEPAAADTVRRQRRSGLTDAVLSSRWRIASLEFDVALGRRFSRTTPELTIWNVGVARSLTPQLALVAAAGRAGSDPVTSVPGSRYLLLGLRLRLGPTQGVAMSSLPPAPDRSPFRIGPALPAGREVIVRVPAARTVELAGDFTDWRPVRLDPVGAGSWRTVLPIRPGLHRLAIRIDHGEWRAPPGARPIASEFGGEVAEIAVE